MLTLDPQLFLGWDINDYVVIVGGVVVYNPKSHSNLPAESVESVDNNLHFFDCYLGWSNDQHMHVSYTLL